jgi:hypothetical protein
MPGVIDIRDPAQSPHGSTLLPSYEPEGCILFPEETSAEFARYLVLSSSRSMLTS